MDRAAILLGTVWLSAVACPGGELPLLVGGHAHGAHNIDVLARLGLGNFVWIPAVGYTMGNTRWDAEHDIFADVEACVRNKLYFMITQRRGLGDKVRPGGFPYGGHSSGEIHDARTIRRIRQRAGRLFVGLHGEELDADFVQEGIRPSFRARSPELYDFTDRAGGRRVFEAELRRLNRRYEGYGTRFVANLCVTYHHSGFRSGAAIVLAELFEHLPTTELQLAFLRGGARQFGGTWGVWVSPWFWGTVPCEDKKLWPAKQAQVGAGHSASAFRRALFLAYVSGARLLTAQETEPLFSRADDGGYKLAAWGQELKRFWEYTRKQTAPLRPIPLLAVLIDRDNGWAPAHLWQDWNQQESIWAKLPPTRADKMFTSYLDVLLPGFARTRERVMNKTDLYPGYFAATPAGPFDIVSSDIAADKLAAYPVVVVLGGVNVTPRVLATLNAYVKGGGTLLVSVVQMRNGEAYVQDEPFLGARLGTRIYASNKIVRTGPVPGVEQKQFDEPWYCAVHVEPTTADVLATDHEHHPVLLRNRFGRGVVYLATPEYMSPGYGDLARPLHFFAALLPGLVQDVPIRVTSAEPVSWVAAFQGTHAVVVALANHGKQPTKAEVLWQGGHSGSTVDFGSGRLRMERSGETARHTLSIPAEDVVVLRITTG